MINIHKPRFEPIMSIMSLPSCPINAKSPWLRSLTLGLWCLSRIWRRKAVRLGERNDKCPGTKSQRPIAVAHTVHTCSYSTLIKILRNQWFLVKWSAYNLTNQTIPELFKEVSLKWTCSTRGCIYAGQQSQKFKFKLIQKNIWPLNVQTVLL